MSKGYRIAQALLATSLLVGWAGAALAQGAVRDQLINADKPKLINNPTLLTLNLSNADVRAVLEMMGKKGGMNLIIDDSVTGQLSALSLKAVPLDEAFNLVLKMKNLSAKRLGTTLLIATEETFRRKGFAGTQTAMLRFDNAKIDDVETIVKQALSEDSGTGDGKSQTAGTLDKSVRIIKDVRTNSLLITAPEDVIDKARALKALLDVPTPQVEIDVRMIEVSENNEQRLGVNYGFGGAKIGAGFNNANPDTTAGGTGNQAGNPSTTDGGIALNYSALGNFTANFNARLDALVSEGVATVKANPKVVAQDNKPANIQIVNRHPVIQTQTTVTGTTTNVTFVDVGQTLTITPRIDTRGFVTLELNPTISAEGGSVIVNGNPVPIINSRSVNTSMRVRDNESIIIGGLKRDDVETSTSKIPILGDLPILGALFRTNDLRKSKTDIILEVTPHIQMRLQSSETVPSMTGGDTSSAPTGAPKF